MATSSPSAAASPSRIAIIEEDPRLLPALRRLLDEHHLVDGYGGGATALAGVKRRLPDVVVLSTTVEDMAWTEVLRRLPPDVPVVALSLCNDEAARDACLQQGCFDHLVKPLADGDLLLASVATCLEATRARQKGGPRRDRDRRRR